MVFEYIGGGDLKHFLQKFPGKISWKMTLKMAVNITGNCGNHSLIIHNRKDAVAFLHRQNPKIIHRDLKSPNVLVRPLNRVVLTSLLDGFTQ